MQAAVQKRGTAGVRTGVAEHEVYGNDDYQRFRVPCRATVALKMIRATVATPISYFTDSLHLRASSSLLQASELRAISSSSSPIFIDDAAAVAVAVAASKPGSISDASDGKGTGQMIIK